MLPFIRQSREKNLSGITPFHYLKWANCFSVILQSKPSLWADLDTQWAILGWLWVNVGQWGMLALTLRFSLPHTIRIQCLLAISKLSLCLNQLFRTGKEVPNLSLHSRMLTLHWNWGLSPPWSFWMGLLGQSQLAIQRGTNLWQSERGRKTRLRIPHHIIKTSSKEVGICCCITT